MKLSKDERNEHFEQKQIKKLLKMQSAPRTTLYIIILFALILLVDIVDNFCTNSPGNIQSNFINEFFVYNNRFSTFEEGLAYHSTISMIAYVIGLITPFYKALGDKYGRKPLFFISTLGMTIGMSIILFSKTYFMFMVGTCINTFFLGHDIQILYILEEAPSKHRAKIYSIIKALGGLSSLLIPVFRTTLMKNDESLWRNIYIVPVIMGLIVSILVFLFAKESSKFQEERIKYLNTSKEEREKIEKEIKEKNKKWGIKNAIKYIFMHKELKNLLLTKCLFDVAILSVQNYNSIMKEQFLFSESDITTALYFFPIFYAISLLISGVLADKIGRKKTILIFGFSVIIAFSLFYFFCSKYNTSSINIPVIVGIMYGIYLGSYWIGRDYMEIMATEMVPTEIRSSIIGAFSLLVYSGMALGLILQTILLLFLPVGTVSLIVTIPFVSVSVILLLFIVKETKGTDYSNIV